MLATRSHTSPNLIARDQTHTPKSVHDDLLRAGVLPVGCRADNLPQRLDDIRSLRQLAPNGTQIQLVLDHDVASTRDIIWISTLLKDRHYAGMSLDMDVGITIISDAQGIESFSKMGRDSRKLGQVSDMEP